MALRFSRRMSVVSPLILGLGAMGALAQILPPLDTAPPQFSESERKAIVQGWNAPGRYVVEPRPDPKGQGPFVVRLTPEASRWFAAYNRFVKTSAVVKTSTVSPGIAPAPGQLTPSQGWENWVAAKISDDRALAEQRNDANNAFWLKMRGAPSFLATPTGKRERPELGPIPADLAAELGTPPSFAASVVPSRYTVHFESGETVVYTDNLALGSLRYPAYRFAQGVVHGGTPLSKMEPTELDRLFATAALTPAESHVMRAVSRLEGGFEAVNTYDTGFVSVGFIQFAALESGAGSLATLLASEKSSSSTNFQRDFRDYGLDVNAAGALVALDPATGAELVGNEAVHKIIDDKRLTAVFQLVGNRSDAFRAAQIRVAKAMYYPATLPVQFKVGEQIFTGQVSDFIHSEAGLATLLDRKVNTGNLRPLNDVLAATMQKHQLTQLADLGLYEREIIAAMKWRGDFLEDETLIQPQ